MKQPKPVFDNLKKSVDALSNKSDKCIHIKQLRFPNYRGLEENAVLSFDFPITALLGCNGTNKSSILYALYGCPKGQSIGDFWFETKIDGIPATRNGLKQSVTHTYIDNQGTRRECIKARAPRRGNPDYWESVKPTVPYGFSAGAKRQSPIDIDVLHLDFRGQLPAFDKYYYFPDSKHLARRASAAKAGGTKRDRRGYRKQDYLRNRSSRLLKELDKAAVMDKAELEAVRYILERDYTEGVIVQHDLFHGHSGATVRFKTPSLDNGYSEAFAGSGESAVALLVHEVLKVNKRSLILLDEPETSLHPRAQNRMLEFLATQAVKKDLQIVMATHSTFFVELLPQSAIRVLFRGDGGFVQISSTHSWREALHEIGNQPAGGRVLVEDERAKKLVIAAIENEAPQAKKELRVEVSHGGAQMCYRDMYAHARSGSSSVFYVLDGDHRPEVEIPAPGELPQGKDELAALINELTRGPNHNGPKLGFADVDHCTMFIEFLRKYVRYLPGKTPEQLVWDNDEMKKLLNVEQLDSALTANKDYKERLRLAAEKSPGTDAEALFSMLLTSFLRRENNKDRAALVDIVNQVRGLDA